MSARIVGAGGVGAVIDTPGLHGYYLKLVMRSSKKTEARRFWNAVRSIQAWCAEIRFNSGFTKIPVVMQYWIREDQAGREAWFNETRLDQVIHHCGRLGDLPSAKTLSPELAEIKPEDYVLCSDELLRKIYRDDHAGRCSNLNLLVTYPIQAWGESVDSLIRANTSFDETELLQCLYQGLRSIQFLYKRGCAHRDIKPSNILLEEFSHSFRLTDFDAFLSPESPSSAGTEAFLPEESIRKQLWAACRNDREKLEYYVRLDCFALAGSILCMAEKTARPVWEDLWLLPDSCAEIVGQLSAVVTFDVSRLGGLIDELEEKLQTAGCETPIRHTPFDLFNRKYLFDEMDRCENGILGTFHDPLRGVGQITAFDPLMKVPFKDLNNGSNPGMENASAAFMLPLGSDAEAVYFHAPDDARTGKRPVDFSGYIPKSLLNTRPSESEIKTIMQCAEQLNGSGFDSCLLPHREQIVWVDGEIKVLWQLSPPVGRKVDYKTYFRYLLTGETGFSDEDWLFLLKILPELKNHLTPEICSRLVKCFLEGNPRDLAWIFGIAEFRQQIAGQDLRFTLPQWLAVRAYTGEYEDRIPASEEINLKTWNRFLSADPELVRHLPDDQLPLLDRDTWVRLLGRFPELAGQCPCLNRFSAKNWGRLLLQQPQLANLCPAGIEIPEKWKKRMRKKNGIPCGTGQSGRDGKKII